MRLYQGTVGLLFVILLASVPADSEEIQNPPADHAGGPLSLKGNETWEGESRFFDRDLVIENGSTLIVRGTTVAFSNASLIVEAGGRLVLESTAEVRAGLTNADNATWNGTVRGEIILQGHLRGKPAFLEGLGGHAQRTALGGSGVISFDGGLYVPGTIRADRALVKLYTSGIFASGVVEFTNSDFYSPRGMGLVASGAKTRIESTNFAGPGGSIFITASSAAPKRVSAELSNLTFQTVGTAMQFRDVDIEAMNITVRDADSCAWLTGAARVNITNLSCSGFRSNAVSTTPLGARTPSLRLNNFSTEGHDKANVVLDATKTDLVVTKAHLGYVNGSALWLKGSNYTLYDVEFGGALDYAVRLNSPLGAPERAVPGTGLAGTQGWVLAQYTAGVVVRTATGVGAPNASVDVYLPNGSLETTLSTDVLGATTTFTVDGWRVGPAGEYEEFAYDVHVAHASAGVVTGELRPVQHPTLVITLPEPVEGARSPIPEVTPLALAIALVGIALFARGRRRA
ncbi:MAG: hypothetical protein HY556_10525 [Euryarchaeota archaeon]|nr:hypothetical protein [Euryarchaeota archaeon]